jgi:hypothetical protein
VFVTSKDYHHAHLLKEEYYKIKFNNVTINSDFYNDTKVLIKYTSSLNRSYDITDKEIFQFGETLFQPVGYTYKGKYHILTFRHNLSLMILGIVSSFRRAYAYFQSRRDISVFVHTYIEREKREQQRDEQTYTEKRRQGRIDGYDDNAISPLTVLPSYIKGVSAHDMMIYQLMRFP